MPDFNRLMRAFLTGLVLCVGGLSSAHAQEAREVAAALNAIGQLQALGQRGAKQYLMFQFRIGDIITKDPLRVTVDDFDRTLGALQIGNRLEGVPAAPNAAIREQLEKTRQDWAVLRKIYTYDPVALRREANLIPFEEQRKDPILVKYVDRLTAELQTDLEALASMYEEVCTNAGHSSCGVGVREAGRQRMLTEAIAKDILMIILNISPGKNKDRLQLNSSLFETTLEEMTAGSRAEEGGRALGQTMLHTITGYWQQLKLDVDSAARARHGDINIDQLLRVHRELVEELDSFAIMAVETARPSA